MKGWIFLLLFPPVAFSALEGEKTKLSKIQDNIKKIEESLKEIRKKGGETQRKIDKITSLRGKNKESLKRTEGDIKKLSKSIDIIEERITNLSSHIAREKNGLSFLVKELWFFKANEPLFFNISDEKEHCLTMLIDELVFSIEGREIERGEEIVKKGSFEVALKKTEEKKKEIASNIEKQNYEIILQNKVLQETKKEEEKLQKSIAKLKQDQKRLEELIAKLEEQRKKLPKDKTRQPVSSLIWPTKSRNIARGFGKYTHPEAGTTLINKGIDISAPFGSPVFAVADGKVAYADSFMGYGNLIMIDHNGSLYSIYAHLSEMNVKTEDKVTKGQIIGYVGKSREMESPILHFEIRLNGQTQDPLDWIN